MGLTFADIVKIAEVDTHCAPYIFRVGCFECIRSLMKPLKLADDVPRDSTGSVTNEDCTNENHVWFVQACLFRGNAYGPEIGWGYGAKIAVSPHMAEGELVKKFFVAARDFSEHEVREAFEYKGRKILGPHISLGALWEAAATTETRAAT